ncbi:MAG: oligosaccharide flippase family protein [Rickettsiales bacterium]
MLARHVLGYIPSLVIPALSSFVAIYCYTRLMEPDEYGYYALALSAMTLLNAVFFYWLQVSIPRLMPQAVREGKSEALKVTSYVAHGIMSFLLAMLTFLIIGFIPGPGMQMVAWLAVPLALARAALNMNQAFHRSALDFKRYNLLECGQALLGLIIGLVLVYYFELGVVGAILGMVIGMMVMLMVDIKVLTALTIRQFDREQLREITRFGWPLVLSFGLSFLISTSDRFIIEHFRDASEVGIYAAGYSLMDRIATIVFMIVATPSFPLTVHKLEQEGVEAAREQTYHNGVAILVLALPACAGLMLTTHHLAELLIGEDFRSGAALVMPWIAASALFNGMTLHYFDHAFHLAKKPLFFMLTQGPVAIFNVMANLIIIPKLGYMGAAYSTTASYMLLMFMSITIGRIVFKIRFPFKPAFQIFCSVILMAAVLELFTFPVNMLGLTIMVFLGGVTYGAGLLLFNVMSIRQKLPEIAHRYLANRSSKS